MNEQKYAFWLKHRRGSRIDADPWPPSVDYELCLRGMGGWGSPVSLKARKAVPAAQSACVATD